MNALFDEMDKQVKPIDENLTFEFSRVRDDCKRELVISADGTEESFPTVTEMVQAAPPNGFSSLSDLRYRSIVI